MKTLFFKSYVKQHQRRLKSGEVITVNAHNDNRRKSPLKANGRAERFRENIEQVRSLYGMGSSIASIASQVGINRETVTQWLKKEGLYQQSKLPITDEQKNTVIEMYSQGVLTSTIASSVGISRPSVMLIVGAAGIKRTTSEAASLRMSQMKVGATSRGRHGAFHSRKTGRWIPTASTYEYARLIQLDLDDSVLDFYRCSDFIPYSLGDRQSTYNPDIEVKLVGGGTRVEEVKPENLTETATNAAKFEAAIRFYRRNGIKFCVITENDIGTHNLLEAESSGLNTMPDDAKKLAERARAKRYRDSLSLETRSERNKRDVARQKAKRATAAGDLKKSNSGMIIFVKIAS